ncbi:hypothetical protein PInf_011085 [Phytophthora infestans]|nr:hypothetical protein PInf_011065 [Phytophthora infestans]KAI9994455.1 hypothetical protein PInf_011085 [Phytophthora infestans]
MARMHKIAHIKAAMTEKERLAEEARRADIARVHDARTRSERVQALETVQRSQPFTADLEDDGEEGKSAEDITEEQADDAKVAETAGKETTNGSDSSGVLEEDVAQTQAQQNSWASLVVSIKEYMEAARQKIVVKEVINIARRNASLRSQVRYQGLRDSKIPLVPFEMEPYERKFICIHGWSERDRSTGKRTSYKLNTTD